jgi:ABC-type branched-subunit amino acid transport system ATPase component
VTWGAGEHVAVFGDTGSGKTYLLSRLLPLRPYVIFAQTKADDTVKKEFTAAQGWRTVRTLRDMDIYTDRYVLDPVYSRQRMVIGAALELVWRSGNRCIAMDEEWYAEQQLGLKKYVERLLTQGRSKKITVVCGAQRPVLISRFVTSQCKHVFSFRLEGRDIKTIQESTTPQMEVTKELSRYQFAYFNRATRRVLLGTADNVAEVFREGARPL